MKDYNVKLKALVDASTKLQLLHDSLRSAGFVDLADDVFRLGQSLSKELGRHVVSNGIQPLEVHS